MKLIDMLVDAGDTIPFFGVHTKYLAMDPDGRVYGYCEMPSPTVLGWGIPDALYSTDGRGCLIQIDRDDVDGKWQSAIITREQYEAALAAKNGGWIDWGGGLIPISANTFVDVKFNNGDVRLGKIAGEYSWEHAWEDSNIIAYRLHRPQEAEQAEADDEADLNECASQDAVPLWSGEGLPPIGCECKVDYGSVELIDGLSRPDDGDVVRVVSHEKTGFGTQVVVVYWNGVNGGGRAHALIPKCLRPLLTEAERKREEAVRVIYEILEAGTSTKQDAADIYNSIAAGKIPGVKLED